MPATAPKRTAWTLTRLFSTTKHIQPKARAASIALVCLVLAALTLLTYWQAARLDFVDYDDPEYVTDNPHVQAGLTMRGIVWALQSGACGNWHPLTWVSHMLDCQWYGLNATGHHLTNVAFHVANTILLFLVFQRMTAATWPAALVAALFALHPLHVESVAWIAERKDVLSTFFLMLTLWAYSRFTAGHETGRQKTKFRFLASGFYWLTFLFLLLGLLSKPMLVTLPFVLLLLDYWPLGRFVFPRTQSPTGTRSLPLSHLLLEKCPLLVLSGVFSVIAYHSQQRSGAMVPNDVLALNERLANALVSHSRYLGKIFWPEGLAVFYPRPESWHMWQVAGAALLLTVVSAFAAGRVRRQPYLLVGWLWFLGTLIPVIGLVQVGSQAMADRYTYVPSIGVFIMLAWGGGELLTHWRVPRAATVSIAALMVTACAACTLFQLRYWRNSETLFMHALRATGQNCVAYNILGLVLQRQGRLDEAVGHYAQALQLDPDYAVAHYNLAAAFRAKGMRDEAVAHFKQALLLQPGFALAHNGLGRVLLDRGSSGEALTELQQALRLAPDNAEVHNNLGIAYVRQGQTAEAVKHFEACLHLHPNDPDALYNLGNVAFTEGKFGAAVLHYQTAVQVKPDFFRAHHNLGMSLAELGQWDEAVAQYGVALKLHPDFAPTEYQLADALLKQGKPGQASSWFAAALKHQPDFAEAHHGLGLILAKEQNFGEALPHLRKAATLKPDWADALNDVAWLLATCKEVKWRDGPKAVRLAARSVELSTNQSSRALSTLAAAYAEAGQYPDAVKTIERALKLAEAASEASIADYRHQLELYQAGKPHSP